MNFRGICYDHIWSSDNENLKISALVLCRSMHIEHLLVLLFQLASIEIQTVFMFDVTANIFVLY